MASALARGGWEALLGKAGLWGRVPRVGGIWGLACPAHLVGLPCPDLLGQLGPAVQQVIPEAGNVLCVLGQRAVQLVHVVPQALPGPKGLSRQAVQARSQQAQPPTGIPSTCATLWSK